MFASHYQILVNRFKTVKSVTLTAPPVTLNGVRITDPMSGWIRELFRHPKWRSRAKSWIGRYDFEDSKAEPGKINSHFYVLADIKFFPHEKLKTLWSEVTKGVARNVWISRVQPRDIYDRLRYMSKRWRVSDDLWKRIAKSLGSTQITFTSRNRRALGIENCAAEWPRSQGHRRGRIPQSPRETSTGRCANWVPPGSKYCETHLKPLWWSCMGLPPKYPVPGLDKILASRGTPYRLSSSNPARQGTEDRPAVSPLPRAAPGNSNTDEGT